MTVLPTSIARVTPADKSYRLLRSTYTAHHSPAEILLPRSPAEVSRALTYAAATSGPVSVRSGGHGLSGASSNDGGVVIDLGRLNEVTVLDRAARLVRVGAGARWAEVAAALALHRLAISSGDHGNVGVGGLATAGGLGWLVRTYGLTVDHVQGATVVLPSGEVVRADRSSPDLLWAVRGAGSYVGVVTDLDIEAMDLPGLHVGHLAIEVDGEGAALHRWSRLLAEAPRELTMSGILTSDHAGRLVLALTAVVATADARAADAALAPFLGRRGHQVGRLGRAGYSDLMPSAHLHPNVGQQPVASTNALLERLSPASAHALVGIARHPARPLVQVRGIGGAANDIAADATAYAHRSGEVLVSTALFPPQGMAELSAAVAPLWEHAVGAYRNFESHPSTVTFDRAFPGATGRRVRELAHRYDPDGLLRRAHT